MVSPAQRAIALLIDLAEQGELDPWDVQVVEVIDRFLAEISLDPAPSDWQGNTHEVSLSESGQAFLYASMLVLLKAETLARMEVAEPHPIPEDDLPEPLPDNVIPLPRNLEQRLRRRAIAQPPRQRPVTLGELIEQLELMAEVLEAPPQRPKSRRPKPASEKQASQAINQLSHHENPAELANPMAEFLESHWLRLAGGEEWLEFETLVRAWQCYRHGNADVTASPSTPSGDRVGVFWALLLLCSQSKVELEQAALYHPLKIRLLSWSESSDPALPLAVSS